MRTGARVCPLWFDVLHTQGKDYIVNDICEVMAERGVTV